MRMLILTLTLLQVAVADVSFLIVGNENTARERMPEMLEDMLAEDDNVTAVGEVTDGNFTDYVELLDQEVGEALNETWTWVLFQEEQTVSALRGASPRYDSSQAAAVDLADYVSSTGTGATSLFVTSPANLGDDFVSMQDAQIEGYKGYAEATGAARVPVGEAFKMVYNSVVDMDGDPLNSIFSDLFDRQGTRPSREGSYLIACVCYGSMTGKNPQLLEFTPQGVNNQQQETLLDACVGALNSAGASFPTARPSPAPTVMPATAVPTSTSPTSSPTTSVPTVTPTTAIPTISPMPSVSKKPSNAPIIVAPPSPAPSEFKPIFTDAPAPTTSGATAALEFVLPAALTTGVMFLF